MAGETGDEALENGVRVRILVVCLGNICRSPAGEAALVEAAAAAGVAVEVESAGLGPWHVGQPPHLQVREAGRRAGLVIEGSGRQVTAATDLDGYDLVLAMDRTNLEELRRLAPHMRDRIHLFRSFDPDAPHPEVPDPYGLADHAYDETIGIVRAAAPHVVAAIARPT
jgi:protein-tyrosine phosphatase